MPIKIAARFSPFSHLPGTKCLIPGSALACEVYPALLRIYNLAQDQDSLICEIHLLNLGPLQKFCVMQDLEKGAVIVTGITKNGFMRYELKAVENQNGWLLLCSKMPQNVSILLAQLVPTYLPPLEIGKAISVPAASTLWFLRKEYDSKKLQKLTPRQRLSFGCHKAQDFDAIRRRQDIREILPLWYWLAQSVPTNKEEYSLPQETATLWQRVQAAIDQKKTQEVTCELLHLFNAGFISGFFPQHADTQHLGFDIPVVATPGKNSNMLHLAKIFPLLESLFFREDCEEWHILPCLAPDWHCGRITNLKTKKGHKIALEWTKKFVRQVEVQAVSDIECLLIFPSDVKSFRLRSLSDKKPIGVFPNKSRFLFKKNKTYLFDNFEK